MAIPWWLSSVARRVSSIPRWLLAISRWVVSVARWFVAVPWWIAAVPRRLVTVHWRGVPKGRFLGSEIRVLGSVTFALGSEVPGIVSESWVVSLGLAVGSEHWAIATKARDLTSKPWWLVNVIWDLTAEQGGLICAFPHLRSSLPHSDVRACHWVIPLCCWVVMIVNCLAESPEGWWGGVRTGGGGASGAGGGVGQIGDSS